MKKIRLLLVDDHSLVRAGIRQILKNAQDIQIVGEATNGAEALQMIEHLSPDILLLDMEMPVLNGIEVSRRLRAKKSPIRILALSAYNDKHYIHGLLSSGVTGYLTKDEAPKKLVEAIHCVARGDQAPPVNC